MAAGTRPWVMFVWRFLAEGQPELESCGVFVLWQLCCRVQLTGSPVVHKQASKQAAGAHAQ